MNKETKALLAGFVIFIITVLILKNFFGLLVGLIIGFIIGAVVVIVMIALSRGERPADVAEEVVRQAVNPDPGALRRRVEEQLVRLNEKLRLGCPPKRIVESVEEVIDLLLKVVPRALQESPGSEATFNLEKLSTDYLPDLVADYLGLSEDDREFNVEKLVEQLSNLKETIFAAEKSMDEGNLDSFHISREFLRAKNYGN